MKQWEFEERWKQGIEALAKEEERMCGDWESAEGLSEDARRKLLETVEARERAKSIRPFRMKRRYVPVLAAALVLLLGMCAAGERVWRSENSSLERETGITTKIDNETKESALLEAEEIYGEIADRLGIAVLRMAYMPEGTVLEEAVIRENLGWTALYYLYDENVIAVDMSKKTQEVSANVQWDGKARKLEVQPSEYYGYEIEAYCTDEEQQLYAANILYGNGYYTISGKFEDEEEFLRILEKIYFN